MSQDRTTPGREIGGRVASGGETRTAADRTGLIARAVAWASWIYLALVVAVWICIRAEADRWWLATLMIFGPRWIWGLPFIVLIPAALLARRRSLWIQGLAILVVAGPIMGFCFPWRKLITHEARGTPIRVLTCNVDSEHLNARALRRILDDIRPDVVALQEWSEKHRDTVFGEKTWHVQSGRGVCLGSRFCILGSETLADEHDWRDMVTRYDLEGSTGTVRLFNVHLSTPRDGIEAIVEHRQKGAPELQANIAMREAESTRAVGWIAEPDVPTLVAGDFNMPVESAIYRETWGRFHDAFATAGFGFGHTKFTRWYGIRIDHILSGPGWRCRQCWVGPEVGSDHRPVIADLEWIEPKD
jgi:endonuclease/exonuclease/phosphatase family metal-dependent hydrolase